MAISEQQRQEYLETMGIHSYFPRYNLPAAKPSVLCDWPELIASVEAQQETSDEPQEQSYPISETPAVVAVAVETIKERKVADIFMDKAVEDKKAVSNIAVKIPDTGIVGSHSTDHEEVRFQMAFIRVSNSLCILNQIPHIKRGSGQISSSHKSLLSNILKSIQVNIENIQFDDLPFCWPMTEGKHIDKSEKAAKETLNSYLEQKQSDGAFKYLLVMGELASSYTISQEAPWEIISTRSLDEMLTMPNVKRDVWQEIQGLTGLHASV